MLYITLNALLKYYSRKRVWRKILFFKITNFLRYQFMSTYLVVYILNCTFITGRSSSPKPSGPNLSPARSKPLEIYPNELYISCLIFDYLNTNNLYLNQLQVNQSQEHHLPHPHQQEVRHFK